MVHTGESSLPPVEAARPHMSPEQPGKEELGEAAPGMHSWCKVARWWPQTSDAECLPSTCCSNSQASMVAQLRAFTALSSQQMSCGMPTASFSKGLACYVGVGIACPHAAPAPHVTAAWLIRASQVLKVQPCRGL